MLNNDTSQSNEVNPKAAVLSNHSAGSIERMDGAIPISMVPALTPHDVPIKSAYSCSRSESAKATLPGRSTPTVTHRAIPGRRRNLKNSWFFDFQT